MEQLLNRVLRTLKTTLVLSFLVVVQLSAQANNLPEIKLNIGKASMSLLQLMDRIEEQSDILFFYVDKDVEGVKVSVNGTNTDLVSILNEAMRGTGLDYEIRDRHVSIKAKEAQAARQDPQITISGRVTDEAGEPLIGATVFIDGTNIGTATGMDGAYSLQVPPGSLVTYRFIGYNDHVIEAGSRTTIDVSLVPSSQVLDEVVVIGYGTARRSDVTGSIASIDSETIQQVQAGNITQALQGRMAGVNIISTGSTPGDGMKIEIRGTRSLTATNDPLVVLDGIPFAGELNDINPSDIVSIDILKDASSTAIYGSRGANGVILITTNRGSRGLGKPTISYTGYVGVNTLFSRFPMMGAKDFIEFKKIAFANGSNYAAFTPAEDETGATDTDWQDLVLRNGFVTSNNIGISAPTERGSVSFGASYYDEDGISPVQGFKRYGLRGSYDQQVGKIIRVGITTMNTLSQRDGAGINIMEQLLTVNPTINPYDENGEVRFERFPLNGTDASWNPLLYLRNDGDRVDLTRSFASYNTFYGEIDIWKGLKFRVNVGANFRQNKRGMFTTGDPGIWSASAVKTKSTAEVDHRYNYNWSVENMLIYNNSFGKHSINAVAMYSAEQTVAERMNASALGVTIDQLQFYNLGLVTDSYTINPANQDYSARGLLSYMGRVMYSYDNKYMLSTTIRSDGASALAPGHKWHTYPAVSVGWNINNEEFLRGVTWLSFLKLRAGYGQTSNQAINPYQTYGMMAQSYYNTNSATVQGYRPNTVANTSLGWEYSETWNYGVDFGLFGGRLTGTAEYYTVDTKDLLMSRQPIAMSGIPGAYISNIARTRNRGFELSLNAEIIKDRGGWSWTAGVNLYTNDNEIVALSSGMDRYVPNQWFVGESINSIYTYKKLGIYQLGEEAAAAGSYPNANAGTIKVAYNLKDGDPVTFDSNGVPSRQLNGNDRMIIGSTDANFSGGFNTVVGWRNFDLTVVGAFRQGGLLISTFHSPNSYLNMLSGRRGQIEVDYWTPDNPTNAYPRPGIGSDVGGGISDSPAYGQTLQFFKNNYLKIRTITLGYNFKGEWMKAAGIGSLRAYVSVQNPFVLFSPYTKESGMDPETNSYAGNNNVASGANALPNRFVTIGFNTPSTRNFLFGLNITL